MSCTSHGWTVEADSAGAAAGIHGRKSASPKRQPEDVGRYVSGTPEKKSTTEQTQYTVFVLWCFCAIIAIYRVVPENQFIPTRCWASYSNGFCFRNMMPCSFDYLIYPYYPAYTMGCYQIVINGDNGRQSILLFLCWFTTLIIAQKAGKCNIFAALFYFPLPIIIGLLQKDSQGFCICHIVFIVEKKTIFIKLKQ